MRLDNLLSVKTSTIKGAGMGLFARRAIRARAIICEYRGDAVEKEAAFNKSLNRDYFIFTLEGKLLDGKRIDNKARWANDARDPSRNNARFEQAEGGRVNLVSTRRIERGEEIFVSYGEEYWREAENERLRKWLIY